VADAPEARVKRDRELVKALRVVEHRRGELVGTDVKPGPQTNRSTRGTIPAAASRAALSRWRDLARHWRRLWPVVRDATTVREVAPSARRSARARIARPGGVQRECATPGETS